MSYVPPFTKAVYGGCVTNKQGTIFQRLYKESNISDITLTKICDSITSEIGLSHSADAYKNCIIIDLNELGYEVEKNASKYIKYKGREVASFDVDVLIEKKIVLMVGVKNMIYGYDIVRVRNYVRRYDFDYGYYINFSQIGVQVQKVFRGSPQIVKVRETYAAFDLFWCVALSTEEDFHTESLAHKVTAELGFGLKENVYQKALQIEFEELGHEVKSEDTQEVFYKGLLVCTIRSDLLIDDRILIELKAIQKLTNCDVGQTRKYLRKYELGYGYLINFSAFGVDMRKVTSGSSNNIQ